MGDPRCVVQHLTWAETGLNGLDHLQPARPSRAVARNSRAAFAMVAATSRCRHETIEPRSFPGVARAEAPWVNCLVMSQPGIHG